MFSTFVKAFAVLLSHRVQSTVYMCMCERVRAVGVMLTVLISEDLLGRVNRCDRWPCYRGVLFPVAPVWVGLHTALSLLMKADATVNRSLLDQWLPHSGNDTNQSMSNLPLNNTTQETVIGKESE